MNVILTEGNDAEHLPVKNVKAASSEKPKMNLKEMQQTQDEYFITKVSDQFLNGKKITRS